MADVNVEFDEYVQIIRINRPAVRNALNASVARGIAAAIDVADVWPEIRASVITGTEAFSSGTHLKSLAEGETTLIEGPRALRDRLCTAGQAADRRGRGMGARC